jgi:branched-chain amino acid transport system substrate-binding protein
LAVEEINGKGGVLGRKLELLTEDSVNPGAAVTKAQKLIEQDKALVIVGEISSASCGAIMEQAKRLKTLYFNTGSNSDELRGAKCNRYTFHIEGCNTMYTKTIGEWQKRQGLINAKWYMLTADYAFGHDLARVSTRFLQDNGGIVVQNDLVPTNTPDYSPYILKIRQANPDFVYINLAGVDQTTFLKQYKGVRLGLQGRGRRDGHDSLLGCGNRCAIGVLAKPLVPRADEQGAEAFTKAYATKHGVPR